MEIVKIFYFIQNLGTNQNMSQRIDNQEYLLTKTIGSEDHEDQKKGLIVQSGYLQKDKTYQQNLKPPDIRNTKFGLSLLHPGYYFYERQKKQNTRSYRQLTKTINSQNLKYHNFMEFGTNNKIRPSHYAQKSYRKLSQQNLLEIQSTYMDMIQSQEQLFYIFVNFQKPALDNQPIQSTITGTYFSKSSGAYKKKQILKLNAKVTVIKLNYTNLEQKSVQLFIGVQNGSLLLVDIAKLHRIQSEGIQSCSNCSSFQNAANYDGQYSNVQKQLKISNLPIQQILIISRMSVSENIMIVLVQNQDIYVVRNMEKIARLSSLSLKIPWNYHFTNQKFCVGGEICNRIKNKLRILKSNQSAKELPYLLHANQFGVLKVWDLNVISDKVRECPKFSQKEQEFQEQSHKKKHNKIKISLYPQCQITSLFSQGLLWIEVLGYLIVSISRQGFITIAAIDFTIKMSQYYQIVHQAQIFKPGFQIVGTPSFTVHQKQPDIVATLLVPKNKQILSGSYDVTIEKISIDKQYKINHVTVIFVTQVSFLLEISLNYDRKFLLGRNNSKIVVCFEQQLFSRTQKSQFDKRIQLSKKQELQNYHKQKYSLCRSTKKIRANLNKKLSNVRAGRMQTAQQAALNQFFGDGDKSQQLFHIKKVDRLNKRQKYYTASKI